MKSCQTPSSAKRSPWKSWFAKVLIPCSCGLQGLVLSSAAIAQTAPSLDTVPQAQFPNPAVFNKSLADAAKQESAKADSFLNFPHYQPSTPGCFGQGLGEAYRVAQAPLPTVAAFYKAELLRQKFTVRLIEKEVDRQIFQVSKDGKTRYLHLFQKTEAIFIFLDEAKISPVPLLELGFPPADYVVLVAHVFNAENGSELPSYVQPEDFARPELFFNPISAEEQARGGIPKLQAIIDLPPTISRSVKPEVIYKSFLELELRRIFRREVREVGEYGGGKLYRLSKDQVTIFLNLVPTKDGQGTIAVTWLADPRQ